MAYERERRAWVQDTTLYVGPTTSVSEVPLADEWAAVTSERLADVLGLD